MLAHPLIVQARLCGPSRLPLAASGLVRLPRCQAFLLEYPAPRAPRVVIQSRNAPLNMKKCE